jgi:IS5 family transposase
MGQDVEEVREKSGDDVTMRRAKEVRQNPMTLTMDTEDEQTNERQVPENDGETLERGKGWRGSEHRQAEDDATPPAQATSPKRSKKLTTDRHGVNPPERKRSKTRTIITKAQ